MPRTKTDLTPAEYAILGLLRRRPAHGYDLQRQLSGRHGLGLVCPTEPAMVYAILKSLSGLELIDGEWDNTSYPPKAIYSATTAGEAEFQRWLLRPVGRIREVRLDLLIKLYFLLEDEGENDLRPAIQLLEAQLRFCDIYAEQMQTEMDAAPEGSFDRIALDAKLSAARLTSNWLAGLLRKLEGKRGRNA